MTGQNVRLRWKVMDDWEVEVLKRKEYHLVYPANSRND